MARSKTPPKPGDRVVKRGGSKSAIVITADSTTATVRWSGDAKPSEERTRSLVVDNRSSVITGEFATVTNLFEIVDEKIVATGSSWDDLANRVGVSRQYLTRVLRERRMPLALVLSVCRAVGLEPEGLFEPTDFVRSLVAARSRSSGGSGGGSTGGGSSLDELAADLRETEEKLDDVRAELRKRDQQIANLNRQLHDALGQLEVERRPSHSPQSQHFTF